MPRLYFAIVGALFGALLLLFAGASRLVGGVVQRDQERELEKRLAAVGETAALLAEEFDPGLAEELAIAYDPKRTALAIARGKPPLPESAVAAIEEEFNALLARLARAHGLRSFSLVSDGGAALASAFREPGSDGDYEPLEPDASALLAIDLPLIERAAATGEAVSTELYEFAGQRHKRVYVPWTTPGRDDCPVLARLEASADYLARIDVIKRRVAGGLTVIGALLAGVGIAVLRVMRRLEFATRQLAREDRVRSLGALASGLAHELRNPLGIMRLTTEESLEEIRALKDRAAAERMEPLARDIVEEIDRLTKLIADILSFARGEGVDAEGTCAVAEAVGSCARWASKAAPASWRVDSNHGDARWQGVVVAMRADALRQVLLNLLRNAVEALEEASAAGAKQAAPTIAVELREGADGMIELLVGDSGPGVPAGQAASIFEPFNSGKAQGTGLGLAISRKLVVSAGGTLELAPKGKGLPLPGATFVARLPRVAAAKGAAS